MNARKWYNDPLPTTTCIRTWSMPKLTPLYCFLLYRLFCFKELTFKTPETDYLFYVSHLKLEANFELLKTRWSLAVWGSVFYFSPRADKLLFRQKCTSGESDGNAKLRLLLLSDESLWALRFFHFNFVLILHFIFIESCATNYLIHAHRRIIKGDYFRKAPGDDGKWRMIQN